MLVLTNRDPRLFLDVPPSHIVHLDRPRDVDAVYSAILCDISFEAPVTVGLLRLALARYRGDDHMALIFVIKTIDPAAYALANALGATEIVSQRHAPRVYGAVPTPILNPADATIDPQTLEAQIATVASSLTTMFGSATRNESFSVPNLNGGADALLVAIKQTRIRDWVGIVRGYDDGTYQHCLLVAGLVAAFAVRLGMSFKTQHLLSQAALVHDIGKARVPHSILNKPSALSSAEQDVMRKHPSSGYYMIAHQGGVDPNILDIVRHHHEYLDGSGYPDRLKADQISELCRLVTICDIYAALIERRAYKQPMTPRDAHAVLVDMGRKLDTRLVDEFRGLSEDMCDPLERTPTFVLASGAKQPRANASVPPPLGRFASGSQ